MVPEDESLEFVIEHLKDMIQEQPDRKIEKISDLTGILSDFMSTFLVVVDALISSSQLRFGAIDQKLMEFEDLLLSASNKGLSELSKLSQVTEKRTIEEIEQPTQESIVEPTKYPPIPSGDVGIPPPPPPPPPSTTLTKKLMPSPKSIEIPEEDSIEISEDMEVEDLAAFAFQQRKKERTPLSRPVSSGFSVGSLKMELMKELKKKFSSEKVTQNDSP